MSRTYVVAICTATSYATSVGSRRLSGVFNTHKGGFQVKKFGVNLIYENDKKDCHSYFEAMVKNASLPYKDDFLDEDASTGQAMAGDKKINPSYVQVNFNNPQDLGYVWHWFKKSAYFTI